MHSYPFTVRLLYPRLPEPLRAFFLLGNLSNFSITFPTHENLRVCLPLSYIMLYNNNINKYVRQQLLCALVVH